MVTANDILDALAKSAAYDSQHCPKPAKLTVAAWVEHFTRYASAVTRDDLLEAVTEYHREPHDRVLQPADLSAIARVLRRDRLERSDVDSPQRAELQARIDAKSQPRSPLRNPQAALAAMADHQARMQRIAESFGPDDTAAARHIPTFNPLRVPCPWCGALAGQRCHIPGPTDERRTLLKAAHPSRIHAAQEHTDA